MADLMRDDVGLGEITRRLESPFQLVIKTQVDIDFLITRAVKRPHLRHAGTAGCCNLTAIHFQLGYLVGLIVAGKFSSPDVLGIGQYHLNESSSLLLLRAGLDRAGLSLRRAAHQHAGIDQAQLPGHGAYHDQHQDAFDSETPPDHVEQHGAAGGIGHFAAPGVHHIGAFSSAFPPHK